MLAGSPRIRRLTLPTLLVVIAAVVIMLACASVSTAVILPDSHQILHYPLISGAVDATTMDPAYIQDYSSYTPIELVYPGLLALGDDGLPQPWAASAMPTFDASADTYTFTVHPDMRWSDGTPIDANTFAYSINRSLSPCAASKVANYLFPIVDAEAFSSETCTSSGAVSGKIQTLIGDSLLVPNSQTLAIKVNGLAPSFLQVMCYATTYAQPKQLINQYGKTWTDHLTDNGGFGGNLYKVAQWDHHNNLILTRNGSFWGTPPRLREVDFKIFSSVSSEYSSFVHGGLELGIPPPAQFESARARSDFHEQIYLAIDYYQPNWDRAPFNDMRVRQAFDLALNKDKLADQVEEHTVTATIHIVPEGMYGYNSGLTGPEAVYYTGGAAGVATMLLQQYADDSCSGRFSQCLAITLYDSNDPMREATDRAAVQMWQAAFPGYPINTHFEDPNTLLTQIYSANAPQIFGMTGIASFPDPGKWLSLHFEPGALDNAGNVNIPLANTLMAQANVDQDLGSRVQLYSQAEQLLVTDVAWIPLDQQERSYNIAPYVKSFEFNSLDVVPLASWQLIYLTQQE